MAFIAPFLHWVVYPTLLRQIERAWQDGPRGTYRQRVGGSPDSGVS